MQALAMQPFFGAAATAHYSELHASHFDLGFDSSQMAGR